MELGVAEAKFDWLTDRVERPGKVALAVLRLHRPRGNEYSSPYCEGCDGDRNTPVDWPCSTVQVVAEAMGESHILAVNS